MKRYIKLILFFFSIVTVISCKEYDTNYPEGYVGTSKITKYASVQTNGDRLVILSQGDAYTEEGATCILDGAPYDYTATGTVNTAVPGIYGITYSSTNADGYSASDFRTVVVISPNVETNDFSGEYLRQATGTISTWTKTAPGVYTLVNPGGAVSGTELTVTVVNYEGTKIRIPPQLASDGSLSTSRNELMTPGVQYTWVFVNPGYGTGVRTFEKQ